jgi:hypothetical protein
MGGMGGDRFATARSNVRHPVESMLVIPGKAGIQLFAISKEIWITLLLTIALSFGSSNE